MPGWRRSGGSCVAGHFAGRLRGAARVPVRHPSGGPFAVGHTAGKLRGAVRVPARHPSGDPFAVGRTVGKLRGAVRVPARHPSGGPFAVGCTVGKSGVRLELSTWPEVESCLERSPGILIPLGSTEQHGPGGLIGTDALVAEGIAHRAASESGDILVAPTLAYAPAQFNLGFPGTVSLRAGTFAKVIEDVVDSLARSGFTAFYFLNGHGANVAPVRCACHDLHQRRVPASPVNSGNPVDPVSPGSPADPMSPEGSARPEDPVPLRSVALPRTVPPQSAAPPPLRFRLKSWWEFPETDALRRKLYGAGEGMHATPSEISITRALSTAVPPERTTASWSPLPARYLRDHAGDAHDDARVHRADFPDGRVGSNPALSSAEDGHALLATAARELAADYRRFVGEAGRMTP